MSRSARVIITALTSTVFISSIALAGQAKPQATAKPAAPAAAAPAPQSSAPAAKAKWVPPVKGTATIGYTKPVTKVDQKTKEVVTHLKIKNMSQGSIALLRVDEYWYDKQGNMMPGDSQRWKKPILPGEVIDIELRTPKNEKMYQNTYKFSHANGNIDAKPLKTLE
jgi:hypothetical protein